jgi:hypothetical protein
MVCLGHPKTAITASVRLIRDRFPAAFKFKLPATDKRVKVSNVDRRS